MARVSSLRSPSAAYDEAVTPSGSVRKAYKNVLPVVERMSATARESFVRKSRRAFEGDNALHFVPRVLTTAEWAVVQSGVEQYARVLRRFLEDHYSGEKSYLKIIPASVMEQVLARSEDKEFAGQINPSRIAFSYGPDLARAENGQLVVIEHNLEDTGGPGEIEKARDTLFKLLPSLKQHVKPVDDPHQYFVDLVERARALSKPKGGRIVLFKVPPYADHEDGRLSKILSELGVDIVTPFTKRRLVVEDGAVYVKEGRKRERVGYLFLNQEHKWLDITHPSARRQFFMFQAKYFLETSTTTRARARVEEAMVLAQNGAIELEELEKVLTAVGAVTPHEKQTASSVPGLLDAILAGKVACNSTPGVSFAGDKQLKGYFDILARFYFRERPILRSIPVRQFVRTNDKGALVTDEDAIHKMFKGNRWKRFVFKVPDGRGGSGVHIGPKMTVAEGRALEKKVRDNPGDYIAEPFVRLSVLDNHLVDMRPLAMVDPGGVVVSPTPFARGVPVSGDGKVNLSQKGREFAAMVVRGARPG